MTPLPLLCISLTCVPGKGISRTITNGFSNLCHQKLVNAKGEVTSRDVLLKSELAAFVSAKKEAAPEI